MELRQLRYFVALAEELHFGRAAIRSNIAQPPLSMQIKRFEEELGVSLFFRTKRKVALTPAGAALLQHARTALQAAEDGTQAAKMADRGEIGPISIGFVSSVLYSLLPNVIRTYRERYPKTALRLQELSYADPTSELMRGRIDVALVRTQMKGKFSSILLFRETLGVALPKQHRLAKAKRVTLAQLKDEDFIMYRRQTAVAFFDSVISRCQQAGFAPNVTQQADRTLTVFSLVAAGLGVALVPSTTQELAVPGVVYKPLDEVEVSDFDLLAVWRSDNTSPSLRAFINVLAEVNSASRGATWIDSNSVA